MKIFDAHFHIIDPNYPLVANNGYLPPEFTTARYQAAVDGLSVKGGAVVSGSFQAFDQEYLLHALSILGDGFYGVANIPSNITEKELNRLSEANVVAVRFNIKRGGSAKIEDIDYLSNLLYDKYGWHTELYVDSEDLRDLKPIIQTIPKFSIDHLGLSNHGLNDLLYWVEKGVKVKATGFGRIYFDPIPTMKKIYEVNPNALMFGTDLPSTRAAIPFSKSDIELIKNNFSEEEADNIFWNNARKLYGKDIS